MSFEQGRLAAAVSAWGPVARVLVLGAKGSTPRGPGTSMLVWHGGQEGTIGGGALEWEACAMARARLAEKAAPPAYITLPLGPALEQCCGGTVTLVIEVFAQAPPEAPAFARPILPDAPAEPPLAITRHLATRRNATVPPTAPLLENGWLIEAMSTPRIPVWIWGAGHVGRALAQTLAPLDSVSLTWLDTDATRFPPSSDIPATIAPDLAAHAPLAPPEAHHLILTYSHTLDFALCDMLLAQPTAFIGLIGSATKWARFRKRLAAAGHSAAQISRITCPIGTPALGKHPQAIAISTAAQLLSNFEISEKRLFQGDMTG